MVALKFGIFNRLSVLKESFEVQQPATHLLIVEENDFLSSAAVSPTTPTAVRGWGANLGDACCKPGPRSHPPKVRRRASELS